MASLLWFVAERRLLLDQESGVTGAPPMKSCYVNNGSPPSPVPELEYLGAFLKNSKRHQDIFDHPVIAAMIWAKWNHWQRRQRYTFAHAHANSKTKQFYPIAGYSGSPFPYESACWHRVLLSCF